LTCWLLSPFPGFPQWPFVNATKKAWSVLSSSGPATALDAIVQGCTVCEEEQVPRLKGCGTVSSVTLGQF
jgi:hypothetical protein